jgi:hypothetical protein
MFVCRWQNGDFSAVTARSREEALELVSQPVCLRLTMARKLDTQSGATVVAKRSESASSSRTPA